MPAINYRMTLFIPLVSLALSGCPAMQPNRLGMVTDPDTGLMFGSEIEANMVTDATFYTNKSIKVRTRNTSGDEAFALSSLTSDLEKAYQKKGYQPTLGDDFRLLIDVNVLYSGHVQSNLQSEFAFLGSTAGGVAGAVHNPNPLTVSTGSAAGAALGFIAGSYATKDTYIIVAHVSFGVVKKYKKSQKRVTFSRSIKLKNIDDPDQDDKVIARSFKKLHSSSLAVYAGGNSVEQAEIAAEVRRRIVRIVSDFI